jgi:hypothetical protein
MWQGTERRCRERLAMERLKEEAADVRRSVQDRVRKLLDGEDRERDPNAR